MKWLFALITVVASGSAWADCKASAPGQAAYPVKGMHCEGCVQSIGQYFSKQKAVSKADVSLENGCMVLSWKDQMTMSDQEIADGLKSLGYELAKESKKPNQ